MKTTLLAFAAFASSVFAYNPVDPTEAYIRSEATKEPVFSDWLPALIYAQRKDFSQEYFCAQGSVSVDANGGIQILTTGHVFSVNQTGECSFRVEIINNPDHKALYFETVAKSGDELVTKGDVILMNLGPKPVYFKMKAGRDEVCRNIWAEPSLNGFPMRRLRSALSGKWFEVVGVSLNLSQGGTMLIINYSNQIGESGAGFVDELDRRWVLHGGPKDDALERSKAECLLVSGKKITGVSLLYGPIVGTRLK